MNKDYITQYLAKEIETLQGLDHTQILDAWKLLKACQEGTVWICGNGGSASFADHLAQDLSKQCGLRAHSLTSMAMTLALGNDEGYENIFARQLEMYAKPRDLLIVVSGSGNSPNILKALDKAWHMDIPSLAILGFDGGNILKDSLSDHEILVPAMHMGRSEDGHLIVGHILVYGMMESK
jgi:D-sedoheptulose 7-phosphate isomerase